MYFVYILKSKERERFYIGATTDPQQRLRQHNSGETRSTKPYRPWVLVHTESFQTKEHAMKREWHLKHPVGYLERRAIVAKYKDGGVA